MHFFLTRSLASPLKSLASKQIVTEVRREVKSVTSLPGGIPACFLTCATTSDRETLGSAHLTPSDVVVLKYVSMFG